MATFYSQGNGAWSTLTNWDTNAGGGGSDPASVAAMDDQLFVIQAGHQIEFDVDMSGFANGIQTLTITSHATTPAMLYCKYSGDGTYHLKMKAAYSIVGTNAAAKGRLLANSDGVWGNTGELAFGRKFIIEFTGSTAGLNAQYLDVRLYCKRPTNRYVSTYKTKYRMTGSASADTLTKASHGLVDTTPVMIMVAAGGSLPAPLVADRIYFVVNKTTDAIKLALKSGGTAIDLTTDGSGDIDVYDGHASTSTGEINVLTDVTGDAQWVTTDGHDAVALVNAGPIVYDQQRLAMTTIAAGAITLSANIDSAQYPGARIYLISRNISIRSASTLVTTGIVTNDVGGIYDCEIRNTQGAVVGVTTYYSACFGTCTLTTFNGVGSANYGILNHIACTISGIFVSCNYATGGGNTFGGNTYTSDCIIAGSGTGITEYISTFAGTIRGCTSAVGTVNNCLFTSTSVIEYSNFAISVSFDSKFFGVIRGCIYAFGTASPTAGTSVYFYGEMEDSFTYVARPYAYEVRIFMINALMPTSLIFLARGGATCAASVCCQHMNRVAGANKIFDNYGDIIQTACDGTGDAPSVDPDAGNGLCLEASNIQATCGLYGFPLNIFRNNRIYLAAGTYTITYKLQTTYDSIASGGLVLSVDYIATNNIVTTLTGTGVIAQRDDDTDWSETIAVTFTQAYAGFVVLRLDLFEYEANNEVYIWPVPAVT